jgi:YegS/Rv2252/BmrU family lipid kinase
MRALIIRNPFAGRRDGEDGMAPALGILRSAGWNVSVERTEGPGDATRLASAAVQERYDAVVVAGGDGTINEVVQALANTDTALGYLPYGTVNVWAREVDIPRQAEAAAVAMSRGRIEQIDLGKAGDRYFLLMAGIGFDGRVMERAQSLERYKSRLGVLPYVAAGISTAPFYRGADVELRYDGLIRRVQALMLILSNTRLYGGYFQFAPGAVANDGWLDLVIVRGRGPLALARQSIPLFLTRSSRLSDVETLRVRELAVQSDAPLPVQVDGELLGATPMRFSVERRALRAIVPPGMASDVIA